MAKGRKGRREKNAGEMGPGIMKLNVAVTTKTELSLGVMKATVALTKRRSRDGRKEK